MLVIIQPLFIKFTGFVTSFTSKPLARSIIQPILKILNDCIIISKTYIIHRLHTQFLAFLGKTKSHEKIHLYLLKPSLFIDCQSPFFMSLQMQIIFLFILAIPVSCIAWTVTHEEIFKEPREYFRNRSLTDRTLLGRKFFYLFTCEYCFSFYVTALILIITNYKLLYNGWRGYFISELSLVWIANIYMSLFLFIRTDIKKEGLEVKFRK